jgi:hypothetical protein
MTLHPIPLYFLIKEENFIPFLSVWRQHIFSLGALPEDGENFAERQGISETALAGTQQFKEIVSQDILILVFFVNHLPPSL